MPRVNNEKFYISAMELYGTSAKGVNWASKENQEIRFEIILEMLPESLSGVEVVDAGCGFGDFYNFMLKKRKTPKKYTGIDSLTEMYSIASNNTGCEIILADICKDTLPHANFYVCSGAMNTLTTFETHQFIRNCFLACRDGFIFNILHGDKKSETYNYTSTQKLKDIAKDLGVKKLSFKEGYLENDITVGFFKNQNL
jgi:SAM-dependent methyltransferase